MKSTRKVPRTLMSLSHSLLAALVLVALAATSAGAGDDWVPNPKNPRHIEPGDLTNPLLSPKHARWMVGPISWMLGEKGINSYLKLVTDEEAERFIEDFWKKNSDVRATYDERREEADKLFREGTSTGHRSDRGTIFVLFGEPEEKDWEENRNVLDGDVALWSYPKTSSAGLTGRKPNKHYRFTREGDETIFFQPDRRRDARRRIEQQRGIPRPYR